VTILDDFSNQRFRTTIDGRPDGSRRIDDSGCKSTVLAEVRRSSGRWWWRWCSFLRVVVDVRVVAELAAAKTVTGRRPSLHTVVDVTMTTGTNQCSQREEEWHHHLWYAGIYLMVAEKGPSWPSRRCSSQTSLGYRSLLATPETSYI